MDYDIKFERATCNFPTCNELATNHCDAYWNHDRYDGGGDDFCRQHVYRSPEKDFYCISCAHKGNRLLSRLLYCLEKDTSVSAAFNELDKYIQGGNELPDCWKPPAV